MNAVIQAAHKNPIVLVVDDDLRQANVIAAFLQRRGIPSGTASGGGEALRFIDQYKPIVVVMDVNMPGMSGIDTVKALGRVTPSPKIILISGDPEKIRDANSAKLDIFAAVDKPIPLRMLEMFVRKALVSNMSDS